MSIVGVGHGASRYGQDQVDGEVRTQPAYARLVAAIPPSVPFVGPEALQRRMGRPFTLRLGANESAFGPSPRAAEAMRGAMDHVSYYGDPDCFDLRAAIARLHDVGLDNVVVGAGVDDLLGLVVRTFLDPGDGVVTSLGGYPTFAYHVAGFGGILHRVPYRDDRTDLDALLAERRRTGARMVYLANPDNPSGSMHRAADVQAFAASLPRAVLLVLDEAYADFLPSGEIPVLGMDDPGVVRLRTFSKAHGMAGARVGYCLAARETIAAFDKIRHHFGVNAVAQAGALASLADPDYVRSVVAEVEQGRRDYARLAADLGLVALPSSTNFVAIDMGGGVDRARAALDGLATRGVFVRMPGAAPLDRCIRVTVGTSTERAAFAEALAAVCADLPA